MISLVLLPGIEPDLQAYKTRVLNHYTIGALVSSVRVELTSASFAGKRSIQLSYKDKRVRSGEPLQPSR